MNYKDPLVLILNITVIFVLILLILPTLLNKREKMGVRISFSLIFFVVIVNCTSNLLIFYFEKYNMLGLHFIFYSIPFLFGPAIYYYVKGINDSEIKNLKPHLIIPIIILVFGIIYNFLPAIEKNKIIGEMATGVYLPYNITNTLIILIPQYYFYQSKIFLKNLKINENDPLFSQKLIKKKWANEFTNYMIFSVFSFLIIVIIATFILEIPQMYMDLVGMPLYFPIIYALIAVRSNMISKDLEMQYVLSKVEQETKLNEQRLNISRDLHDNIGAYANSLIAKLDFISTSDKTSNNNQISDLKENANQILSLLRQTIWVLNNDEISAESAFDYIKQYALKTFNHTKISVSFKENINQNHTLDSKTANNIFRIVQEACQNILKHSEATVVQISMVSQNKIEILITDNGIGFSENNTPESHGLKNMKHRALESGLKLEVQSESTKGTNIRIALFKS